MTDLTDRYVDAATRSVPPASRGDIATELRASIADQIDARLERGETPDAAERAVLTELGDPAVLAAQYADRPLHLIGPRYYVEWARLLRLLLWIVVPCVAFAIALAYLIDGRSAPEVVGGVIGIPITVGVHLAFWVTLAFWIAERTQMPTPLVAWTIEALPMPETRKTARVEVILAFIFVPFTGLVVLWDQLIGFALRSAAGPVPMLNPALWPWSLVALTGAAAANVFLLLAVFLARRWTLWAAAANAVLSLAVGGLALALLLAGTLVNPDFVALLTRYAGDEPVRILGIILALTFAGLGVWGAVDGFRKTRRATLGRR